MQQVKTFTTKFSRLLSNFKGENAAHNGRPIMAL